MKQKLIMTFCRLVANIFCAFYLVYGCDDGWIRNGTFCYMFSEDKMDIESALLSCLDQGAYLAEINSQEENDFLASEISQRQELFSIGLKDEQHNRNFTWLTSGQQPIYTNWKLGEPNNIRGKENCVDIVTEPLGTWNDYPCSHPLSYICQKEDGGVHIDTDLQFMSTGDSETSQKVVPNIIFNCTFVTRPGELYIVNWFIGDDKLVQYGPSDDTSLLVLEETTLMTYFEPGMQHGKKLKCGVARVNETFITPGIEDMVNSSSLLLGGTVSTQNVYISKKSTTTIQIRFTIPVGCGYVINTNQPVTKQCLYSLKLFTKEPWSCLNGGIANIVRHHDGHKFCTEPFKMLESTEEWNNKKELLHTVEIATIDRNYEDDEEFFIQLAFDETIAHNFWTNYIFPDIKVIVSDTKACINKVSYSHIDPHMRSANKLYYEQHHSGDFLFYKNTRYEIEVQEKVKQCRFESRVRCACGVAIRAGQDVFRIDQCGYINFLDFTQCGDGGILNVIRVHERKYQVITPIGTRIDITLNKYIPRTLNIDLFMSPKDFQNVEGLSGHFETYDNNYLQHRDGLYTEVNSGKDRNDPKSFIDSWRLLDENNMFINPDMIFRHWSDKNDTYCICNKPGSGRNETVCTTTQDFECYAKQSISQRKCQFLSRQKRSSTSIRNSHELNRLYTLMESERNEEDMTNVSNNITSTDASSLCSAIKTSFVAVNLSDMLADEDLEAVISQCEIDVIEMNDPNMVNFHIETLNNLAKSMLDLNPSYAESHRDEIEYFLSISCPQNCSGHGSCSKNGECICNEGFTGPDCDIDITELLVIDDIEGGGACDIASEDCRCFIIRTNNLISTFTCLVNTYMVDFKGKKNKHTTSLIQGKHEDLFTGICCLHDNKIFESIEITSFAFVHDFSISNDGEHFSFERSVHLYDSACQEAVTSPSSDTIEVVLQTDFCYIDRVCVHGLQNNTIDICTFCQPENNILEWTRRQDCNENKGNGGQETIYRNLFWGLAGFVFACIVTGLVVLTLRHCYARKQQDNSVGQINCGDTLMTHHRQKRLNRVDRKSKEIISNHQQTRSRNIMVMKEVAHRRFNRPDDIQKQQNSCNDTDGIIVIDLELTEI